MKEAQISEFETVDGQMSAFHQELAVLSKKSPHDSLNKFKLGLLNKTVGRANVLLGARRPFESFETFDEETLPSNSDALLMVSQYLTALEELRADNIHKETFGGDWYWNVEDNSDGPSIRTSPPRKISE